jgi:hypothetical protein
MPSKDLDGFYNRISLPTFPDLIGLLADQGNPSRHDVPPLGPASITELSIQVRAERPDQNTHIAIR